MTSLLLLALLAAPGAGTTVAAGRDVDIKSPDGTALKGTYFASERPGPAVLLLHMCNTTRASWEPLAQQLSAAGISALAVDNRGFGDSGGPRFDPARPDEQRQLLERWPGDFDAALAWLTAQPGVDKSRLGAAGGSCGVNNAVKLASRHPDVRSLALLAGSTDAAGLQYLLDHPGVPVFSAAAADDQYDRDAMDMMRWLADLSGNPRNRFVGFKDGRHGTEIFGPHPELPRQMVAWFVDTLVDNPADPGARVTRAKTPTTEFWSAASERGGGANAARLFRQARTRDARARLAPESIVNQLAYTRLRAGDTADALELFTLNVEVHPTSANAHDSLADGYIASGQNELALAAQEKCLELLPSDQLDEQFRATLKQGAQEKLARLKAGRSEALPKR